MSRSTSRSTSRSLSRLTMNGTIRSLSCCVVALAIAYAAVAGWPAASYALDAAQEPPSSRTRLDHVAVLGDVAATGAGPTARLDAWPDQLGRLLGPPKAVRSFVRATASLDADSPRFVASLPDWEAIRQFAPSTVVVALGASDASGEAIGDLARFERGFRTVLDGLAALPSVRRVVVCLPPPAAPAWPRSATYEQNRALLVPMLSRVGQSANAEIVALDDMVRGVVPTFVDGVVADAAAAEPIAMHVATLLLGERPTRASGMHRELPMPGDLVLRELVAGATTKGISNTETWTQDGAAIVGTGLDRGLGAYVHMGEGPFRMRLRFTATGGENNGPQIVLDQAFILFENARGRFQTSGDVFRGRPELGASTEFWRRGEPVEVEIRRAHHDLEILIDGRLVLAVPAPGVAFQVMGLVPMQSTVRLERWTIEEPPPAPAPSSAASPAR